MYSLVQWHDHFPTPAGHTNACTSQDAIGLLGHLRTLLAHIQGQVGQGFEQPNLVEEVPAHCKGVGLDEFGRSLPTTTIL